eukprot:scaffold4060_cov101-Skeletonema_dohrnii-CCMP3373.AAC.6
MEEDILKRERCEVLRSCFKEEVSFIELRHVWCAWNQRLAYVDGSTVPLESAKLSGDAITSSVGAKTDDNVCVIQNQ